MNLVTSKIRRGFGVRISTSRAGCQQLNSLTSDLHNAVFATGVGVVCGAVSNALAK
jgi:hypothetical protein